MRSPPATARGAFWRAVLRFDAAKMSVAVGLRNAIGVLILLGIGAATGRMDAAIVFALGALNTAFSDGHDPYRPRARRMLISATLVGLAVFCGAACARWAPSAVLVAAGWAFGSGMLVTLSTAAGNIGVTSLATLTVFSDRSMGLETALLAGLAAFGGGLVQIGLSLALWPLRRYRAEREALGALFMELSKAAGAPIKSSEAPPASAKITSAQEALKMLGDGRSIENVRCRLLLEQAERSRVAVLTLGRLRTRARKENDEALAVEIDRFLAGASRMMACIGHELQDGGGESVEVCARELAEISDSARGSNAARNEAALEHDAAAQMDSLARQLRVSSDLAAHATSAGFAAFEKREAAMPWRLRTAGVAATLRANLTFRSAAFRHAVRLAVCVALGETLGRSLGWVRFYWLPMTIAVVLKPDFTATFSRGLWRLLGTFAGLLLATGIFHFLPENLGVEIVLIGLTMFVIRWAGPANYGVLVVAITALVVALAAAAGISPEGVIWARAENTAAGGALALLAYVVWPTWERTQTGDAMAKVLEAYGNHIHLVMEAREGRAVDLDAARLAGRLARSNMEASLDRLGMEPGTSEKMLDTYSAMLASSHALAHAALAFEAGLLEAQKEALKEPPSEELKTFARDAERMIAFIAKRLRGEPVAASEAPDLRADHRRLVAARKAGSEPEGLVEVEADRMTNALNTLREQAERLG